MQFASGLETNAPAADAEGAAGLGAQYPPPAMVGFGIGMGIGMGFCAGFGFLLDLGFLAMISSSENTPARKRQRNSMPG